MLREIRATWLGGGHGGERNTTPIQHPKLGQVLSQVISIPKHLLCARNHTGLFPGKISNVKALLYTKPRLGAYLHFVPLLNTYCT